MQSFGVLGFSDLGFEFFFPKLPGAVENPDHFEKIIHGATQYRPKSTRVLIN